MGDDTWEDDDDGCACLGDTSEERSRAKKKLFAWSLVLFIVVLTVLFFVMASYSTDRSRRLWSSMRLAQRERTYCLLQSSSALDAPSVEPYGAGMINFDRGRSLVQLVANVWGLRNVSAVHIFGPLLPPATRAPLFISLSADLIDQYVDYGMSGSLRVRAVVLERGDIDTVLDAPAFYYVGISAPDRPHGTAIRWPLGAECSASLDVFTKRL